MSFFDDDIMESFKQSTSQEFVKREEDKKVLKDKTLLAEIKQEAMKHYKEQLKKPVGDRWFYKDQFGYDIVLIKTLEAPLESNGEVWTDPKPIPEEWKKENYPDEWSFPAKIPLITNATGFPANASVKIHEDLVSKDGVAENIYNYGLLLRGEVYPQYEPLLDAVDKDGKNLKGKKIFREKLLELAGLKSIKEIDRDTYNIHFTIRAHQILEAKELKE